MTDIRFSVVIPTRERAATLQHALRTCLEQDFDDYEVIVSDNHSSPATRAVVDEVASPKVRYFRTDEPLSLASSWDFAASHGRGEYVLLIGDDDGLLPHSLKELDKLARESRQKVIRWDPAFYTWPNYALDGEGDYLRIPLGTGMEEVGASEGIENAIAFRQFYTDLPMIYNSAVHRDVLAAIRKRTGRLFSNRYADVYSGFAIAFAAGRYLSLEAPMSISGQSGASTGVAFFFFRDRSAIEKEFRNLSDRDQYRENPEIPNLSIFPYTAVADAFLDAKRLLFPNDDALTLDRKKFIQLCSRNLRARSVEDWQKGQAALRQSLAGEPTSLKWFDEEIARQQYLPPQPLRMRPERIGFDGQHLHLDAANFGVCDVGGAAELCERILNYRRCGSPQYHASNASAERLALQKVCDERLELIEKLSGQIAVLTRPSAARQWVKSVYRKLARLGQPFSLRAFRPH